VFSLNASLMSNYHEYKPVETDDDHNRQKSMLISLNKSNYFWKQLLLHSDIS